MDARIKSTAVRFKFEARAKGGGASSEKYGKVIPSGARDLVLAGLCQF
ncbi:MAG: hypothetical protein NVV74_24850 [Magnetospirillum sp.]|nr:hypothetical protein [Magnetospirillum sp.]